MTRWLFPLLALSLPALALADSSPAETAVAAYERGLALQSGDPAAAREQFRIAIENYRQLLSEGQRNAKLLANLGHAHLLSGDAGQAVLCYREAERLEPQNPEVRAALNEMASQLGSDAAPARRWDPLLVQAILGPWPTLFLALAVFAAGWSLVFTGYSLRRRWLYLPAMPAVLAGALVIGSYVCLGWQDARTPLGAISNPTQLREGNGANFRPVVDRELPPGTEVRVLARRADWLKVQLASGQRGWLPADDVVMSRY